jgi:hypothetical protein
MNINPLMIIAIPITVFMGLWPLLILSYSIKRYGYFMHQDVPPKLAGAYIILSGFNCLFSVFSYIFFSYMIYHP